MAKAVIEQPSAEALNKSEAFFLKYKKSIIVAVVAVIVVVVGAILYTKYYAIPHEAEASTALAKGQEYFAAEQYELALNGDKTGYSGLLAVIDDYSGTDAANLAALYAGLSYANLGKWQEAVDYIEKFSPRDDQMISPAAIGALADAYAHIGNIDKAIELFKKAAKKADAKAADGTNNSLSPTFLLKAAELLESQGSKDEALAIYREIKSKYVNSAMRQEIDKYIERAK